MAFKQVLNIAMEDCCDTVQLCDITCQPDPCNAEVCVDGYSVAGNINKADIIKTAFNITFPDGNLIVALDIGYIPNTYATGWVELTAGTAGTFNVGLSGYGTIGVVNFNTNLPTTAADLVVAINSNSANTGFRAFIDSTNSSKVFFYNTTDGAGANGAPIGVIVTGDMTAASSGTIEGGTDEPICKSLTLTELWALNSGVVYNSNTGPAWADGVYKFEMISYGAPVTGPDPVEIGRVSETVLFDCNAVSCLKESLLVGEGCGCDDKYDERILKTRLKIEQARIQFGECLFDCAQESILKAGKMCSEVCIDC